MMVMVMILMVVMIIVVMLVMLMMSIRSRRENKEAEALLKDSIHHGPHFADAYSSLASLYAEQVKPPENQSSFLLLLVVNIGS